MPLVVNAVVSELLSCIYVLLMTGGRLGKSCYCVRRGGGG